MAEAAGGKLRGRRREFFVSSFAWCSRVRQDSPRELAGLARLEVHGPAAELEMLKSPVANLNPIWFTRQGNA